MTVPLLTELLNVTTDQYLLKLEKVSIQISLPLIRFSRFKNMEELKKQV